MKDIAAKIFLTMTTAFAGLAGKRTGRRDAVGYFASSRKLRLGAAALALIFTAGFTADASGRILDRIDLGDPDSEARRNLEAQGSIVVDEAYAREAKADSMAPGQTGRRLKPRGDVESELDGEEWMDGWMEFDIRVASGEQTYITVKIWGSESSNADLALMLSHDQPDEPYRWITTGIGRFGNPHFPFKLLWRGGSHRGGSWAQSPPYPGRWIYRTYALPRQEVTAGQERVRLRIQQVDGNDKSPTLYNLYTHTDPYFAAPDDEPRDEPFEWGPARGRPENFEQTLREEAGRVIERIITNENKGDLNGLAEIYNTEWSDHYQDEMLIHWASERLDSLARRFAREGSPRTRWAGAGRGDARPYSQLHEEFEELDLLEEEIDLEGEEVTRREAYARMFKGEFDAFHKSRRGFTNQTYYGNAGLYYLNRALLQLKPEVALSEAEARWFVYEIFGMAPFGPDQREHSRRLMEVGFPNFRMSDAGLTREHGYVAGYGEMGEQFAQLAADVGCPLVIERVARTMRARSHFRVPCNTEDGHRMIRESAAIFSFRGRGYPRGPRYGQGDALAEAALLQDPVLVRLAELAIEHDTSGPARSGSHRIIRRVDHYETFKNMPENDYRLPIEEGEGPYAWADEGNGVFMARHGDSFIYGGLYFPPGPKGINPKGRIYHRTARDDRLVDVKLDTRAPDSGEYFILDGDSGRSGREALNMPEGHESVIAGRKHANPPPPPGTEWPGRHLQRGRAWFYQANYGDYLIGMNTTSKNAYNASLYELDVPEEHRDKTVKDLVTGREVNLSEPVVIGPTSTLVLYVGDE